MALWTPAAITTALWLDASDSSTLFDATTGGNTPVNGGAVARWEDKSGNARHASQTTAASRPEYIIPAQNGLNALRFYATSQHFMNAGTNSTWNFLHDGSNSALFILARCRTVGDNPNAIHTYLSTGGIASGNIGFWIAYDDLASASRNNGLNVRVARGVTGSYLSFDITNDKITPGIYHLISSYIDANNATAGNRTIQRVDGGADFSSNTLPNSPSASNSTSSLHIGRDVQSSTFDFTGDICEIIIINNHPLTADRETIEGYLAWKWGIEASLPAGHPYENAAPTIPSPNTRRRRYAGGYGL